MVKCKLCKQAFEGQGVLREHWNAEHPLEWARLQRWLKEGPEGKLRSWERWKDEVENGPWVERIEGRKG